MNKQTNGWKEQDWKLKPKGLIILAQDQRYILFLFFPFDFPRQAFRARMAAAFFLSCFRLSEQPIVVENTT